jgi:hypothetical protein
VQINKFKNLGFINLTLLLTVLLLICIKLFSFKFFQYNVFTDRDLIRARDLLDNFQLYGAELNYLDGLRIYGGFYYYYLSILTSISSNVNFIFLYFEIAVALSFLYLIYVLKDFGLRSGLISIIFFYTSLNYIPESIILWNPNMGFHLSILSFAFFFKYLINKNYLNLFIGFLLSFLAAQFHLSFLIPIVCLYIIITFIDYDKIINFILVNLIFFIAILIAYSPLLLNIFYNFEYVNLIEIEKNINNQSNIDILSLLKSKLSKFFYLQSFTEISLITNYKIPFMAFVVIGISFFIVQSNKYLFNSIYGHYFYINYKYLSLILILTLLFTSFIFSIFINIENLNTIGYFQAAELRYLTFIIPILSISCGFAFTIIIEYFLNKKSLSALLLISIILFILFSRSVFVLSSNLKDLLGNPNSSKYYQSYAMADNLIDIAINDHNFSKQDILNNFAITTIYNEQINTSLINYQYIVESKIEENSKRNKNCLLSIVHKEFIEKTNIIRMFNDFGIENYEINKIANYNLKKNKIFKATFIDFKTDNSSCPSSMYNSYILTDKEKYIEEFLKNRESNTSYLEKISNNLINVLFKISISSSNYPLNISLDFVFNEKYFDVFTNAKRLRNLTQLDGYWEKVLILNPKLEFTNLTNNKKYQFNIHDGLLGSPLYNTPWFNKFSKPPKGIYKINFIADEVFEGKNVLLGKTYLDTLKIKDYTIEIINNFEIN